MVGIGRDETTIHIRGEGYRETMSGTVSFYDEEGHRLHTIYQAQAPEYGKETFNERFSNQIHRIKEELHQNNTTNSGIQYIGLADGAKDNWTFLDTHTDVAILDFWHACEYLTLVSKMASIPIAIGTTYEQKQWLADARTRLKEDNKGAKELLEEMKKFDNKRGFSQTAKEGLQRAITFPIAIGIENHQHQMNYTLYQQENYPIGSGVTEAACKVIVKQRCSCSGMRWNINSAQHVLNIRALRYSDGWWIQFWNNVDKYGFGLN